MRFIPDKCPKCGNDPECISETAICYTFVTKNEDGEWDWSTEQETEMHWDSSEPELDEEGKASLRCGECHEWFQAEIVGDESRDDAEPDGG